MVMLGLKIVNERVREFERVIPGSASRVQSRISAGRNNVQFREGEAPAVLTIIRDCTRASPTSM